MHNKRQHDECFSAFHAADSTFRQQLSNRGNVFMLNVGLLVVLLLPFGAACANQQSDAVICNYSDKVKQHLAAPPNAEVVEQRSGVDKDSGELTMTHIIKFENGDVATIEQKYCSMYNFSVVYKASSMSEKSFNDSLRNIHKLIEGVEQDYHLKAPLEDIVDMTMNQKKLSLQDDFDYGLPSQAATSNSYVEHSIRYKPLADNQAADAEIRFYFALGGI